MNRIGLGIGSGGGVSQAQRVINAIEEQGGSPASAEKTAISDFFGSLGDGLSLLKALYVPVWAGAGANAINWVTGQVDGSFIGGITHAAGYFEGNGTTGYFSMAGSPSSFEQTADSAIVGFYTPTPALADERDVIASDGVSHLGLFEVVGATQRIFFDCFGNTAGRIDTVSAPQEGLIMGNRKGTSRRIVVFDSGGSNLLASASNGDAGTVPTVDIYLGSRNNDGTADFFSTRRYSVGFVGLGHTVAEETTLGNAIYDMLDAFTTHQPTMV